MAKAHAAADAPALKELVPREQWLRGLQVTGSQPDERQAWGLAKPLQQEISRRYLWRRAQASLRKQPELDSRLAQLWLRSAQELLAAEDMIPKRPVR